MVAVGASVKAALGGGAAFTLILFIAAISHEMNLPGRVQRLAKRNVAVFGPSPYLFSAECTINTAESNFWYRGNLAVCYPSGRSKVHAGNIGTAQGDQD